MKYKSALIRGVPLSKARNPCLNSFSTHPRTGPFRSFSEPCGTVRNCAGISASRVSYLCIVFRKDLNLGAQRFKSYGLKI